MARTFAYYDDQSLSALSYDFLENSLGSAGHSVIAGDVDFYCRIAEQQAGPILDVGTGTGRVAWSLAEAGHEVLGIDLSPAMLTQAEAKRARYSEAVGNRVRFARQDMAQLDVGQTFPLILVPYRSFSHLLTPRQQRAALDALRRHLAPQGLLVLHMIEPAADIIAGGGSTDADEGTLAITHPRTGQTLHYRTLARQADAGKQTVTHVIQYRVTAADGSVVADTEEVLTHRWATRQEMRYLFELTGLVDEAVYGDFHGGAPAPGSEQIWLLRQREGYEPDPAALRCDLVAALGRAETAEAGLRRVKDEVRAVLAELTA